MNGMKRIWPILRRAWTKGALRSLCGSLLVLLTLVGPSRAETFRNPLRIPTAVDPATVFVTDINGDGLPDILYTDSIFNIYAAQYVLHMLLAQPNGSYLEVAPITLPAGVGPVCRPMDTNRDGKQDLVCTFASTVKASLVTFRGNGDGTFASPIYSVVPPSGYDYFYPAVSQALDLNSDGIPDVIVVDSLNEYSYVMLGDGAGGFRSVSKIGSSALPTAVDVNGDGKPDLLLPYGPYVAFGNGDGTFSGFHGLDNYNEGCVYQDMDGDGHLDAVCGGALAINGDITGGTQLVIFHGNPDGSFNPSPIASVTYGDTSNEYEGFGTFRGPLAVADVNGDGIPDVLGLGGNGLAVILGGPGLTFQSPQSYAAAYIDTYGQGAQIADMDGDGLPDIVAAGPNGIYISYAKNDGTYRTAPAYQVTDVIGYTTVADFNGDGIPDIVADGYKNLEISLGKGDGTLQTKSLIPNGGHDFSSGPPLSSVRVLHGDFDGDGRQDLLAYGKNSFFDPIVLYWFRGQGDGTFALPAEVPNGTAFYEQFGYDTVYDINKDGRDDLATIYAPTNIPTLHVGVSNGDGSFKDVTTSLPVDSPDTGSFLPPPAFADFNGDGKVDAVVAASYHVWVLKGHGDGGFDSTGTTLTIPIPTQQSFTETGSIVTGDFDGDGKLDFALSVYLAGPPYFYSTEDRSAVFVYYGNGDGTFQPATEVGPFIRKYGTLAAADFDRDGLTDLLLKTSGSLGGGNAVGIIHGQPGRTFGPEVNYYAGSGLSSVDVADLNHDGFPDLVFGNGDYNIHASSATVLMNLGNVPMVSGTLRASPEPSSLGQAVTLSASLAPPVPANLTGAVSFFVDGASKGAAQLTTNTASLAIGGALTRGTHTLSATLPGDATYPPLTLTGVHRVIGLAVTATLAAAPNPALIDQRVTLAFAVTAASGAPSGQVSFADGGATLGIATLRADGTATLPVSFQTAGNHTLTATYAGDATYEGAIATTVEAVSLVPSILRLTGSRNPALYGEPVTYGAVVFSPFAPAIHPTGTVTVTSSRGAITQLTLDAAGQAAFQGGIEPVGTFTLSATYSGDVSLSPGGPVTLTQVIVPAQTNTALTATPNPAYQGQPVTIAVQVAAPPAALQPTAPDTVQIYDGTALLATVPLNVAIASFVTSSLFVGQHTLTAIYAGDGNLLGSSSAALIETILPSDFSLSVNPTSLSLQTGHHTTFTLTATSIGNFGDTLQFASGPTATYITLAPTPKQMPLAVGGQISTSFYLDTDAVIGYVAAGHQTGAASLRECGILLAALPFSLWLLGRVRRHGVRWTTQLALTVIFFALGAVGCSGIYPKSTPPGQYVLHLTATGAQTGLTHTLGRIHI